MVRLEEKKTSPRYYTRIKTEEDSRLNKRKVKKAISTDSRGRRHEKEYVDNNLHTDRSARKKLEADATKLRDSNVDDEDEVDKDEFSDDNGTER